MKLFGAVVGLGIFYTLVVVSPRAFATGEACGKRTQTGIEQCGMIPEPALAVPAAEMKSDATAKPPRKSARKIQSTPRAENPAPESELKAMQKAREELLRLQETRKAALQDSSEEEEGNGFSLW